MFPTHLQFAYVALSNGIRNTSLSTQIGVLNRPFDKFWTYTGLPACSDTGYSDIPPIVMFFTFKCVYLMSTNVRIQGHTLTYRDSFVHPKVSL